MEALGSCLTNKYSEGYVGRRYYGGTDVVDKVETIAMNRALTAFHLSPDEWAVNVQPYSGSPANFEVYTGLLKPHDRIMGLDLPCGGHLTHGYTTPNKKISATGIFFESMPYLTDPETGLIDYKQLRKDSLLFRPKIIICGGSSYPRDIDYAEFRSIADGCGAMLMCDMAHYAGLVAAQLVDDPFKYCDIVTTTTHKTLRGPRSGMIFAKKDARQLNERIAEAVFPGCQGGPHNHQIAAIAVQMKEIASPEWKIYATNVIENMRALAQYLTEKGYTLACGGTDTHLILWDLKPQKISGGKFNIVCDLLNITLNKNCTPGDRSALNPGGVRIGSSAMTSRGATKDDFRQIGEFLHEALNIALQAQDNIAKQNNDGKVVTLKQFTAYFNENEELKVEINKLKTKVNEWSANFYLPGL